MTREQATAEIGWVAREAVALISERVSPKSDRWVAYLERKRALLDYIEAATA